MHLNVFTYFIYVRIMMSFTNTNRQTKHNKLVGKVCSIVRVFPRVCNPYVYGCSSWTSFHTTLKVNDSFIPSPFLINRPPASFALHIICVVASSSDRWLGLRTHGAAHGGYMWSRRSWTRLWRAACVTRGNGKMSEWSVLHCHCTKASWHKQLWSALCDRSL